LKQPELLFRALQTPLELLGFGHDFIIATSPWVPYNEKVLMSQRGLFITLEGLDGSGKTTQMHRLAERLRAQSRTVLETVEPGGTLIGRKIRQILLDAASQELSPTAELLLYFASRAQNVDEMIVPALDRGEIVLADRFTDSTLAYQGCGRGLGAELVQALDRIACRGLKPDLTLLVDIDVETSLSRARTRNAKGASGETRMDEQSLEFHRKVYEAYQALATREPQRIRRIDGGKAMDEVEQQIWKVVSALV
jgi:dTMP kinase